MSIPMLSFAIIPVPHFPIVYVQWANCFLNDLTREYQKQIFPRHSCNIYVVLHGGLLSHTLSHVFR